MLFIKKFDIAFIGVSGWFAGYTLAQINEGLQFTVLLLTLVGIIWRMLKRKKI